MPARAHRIPLPGGSSRRRPRGGSRATEADRVVLVVEPLEDRSQPSVPGVAVSLPVFDPSGSVVVVRSEPGFVRQPSFSLTADSPDLAQRFTSHDIRTDVWNPAFGDLLTGTGRAPQSNVGGTITSGRRHELILIDFDVPERAALARNLLAVPRPGGGTDFEVIELHGGGVAEITSLLRQYHDLDAIHLVSHGTAGALRLGADWVSPDTLGTYQDAISVWSSSLNAGADLLLYGCDLAGSATGQLLASELATLTGADVAASTGPTGSAALGGDWLLEYRTGSIETATAAATGWEHTLAVNAPPVAADDSFRTPALIPLVTLPGAGVLANDADPNGGTLTAQVVTDPAHGLLVFLSNGSFVYTPDLGFTGTDTFTYRVTDALGAVSNVATVTVHVGTGNSPPTITTLADQTITLGGTTGKLAFTVGDAESSPGSLVVTATSDNQAVVPDGNLKLSGGSGSGGRRLTVTSGPAVGSAVITVTVSDGAETVTTTFTVTVGSPTTHPAPTDPLPADPTPTSPTPTPAVPTPTSPGPITGGPPVPDPRLPPLGTGPTAPGTPIIPNVSGTVATLDGAVAPGTPHNPVSAVLAFVPGVEPVGFTGSIPLISTGATAGGTGPGAFTITPRGVTESGRVFGSEDAPAAAVAVLPGELKPGSAPTTTPPSESKSDPAPAPVAQPVLPTTLPPAPATALTPAPPLPPVADLAAVDPVFAALDQVVQDVHADAGARATTDFVVATGATMTAGYALLNTRAVYWFLSALLARPAVWRRFDPLDVIYAWEREQKLAKKPAAADGESLQSMVG